MALCAMASPARAQLETGASVSAGYLQYDALWVGDPVLGGFDGRSSIEAANRFIVSPEAELTWRPAASHRLRLNVDGRSLQRLQYLDDELDVRWTITSDGVPVDEAVKERAFIDEASWRFKPPPKAVDLRLGMLPFSAGDGRILVESWPGARWIFRPGRIGGPALTTDLRAAVRFDGSVQGALEIRKEWSHFEHLGVEVAAVHDTQGIVPILTGDLSTLLAVFGAANSGYIQQHLEEIEAFLVTEYGDEDYGLYRFGGDATSLLDMSSDATLAYLTFSGSRFVGPVEFEGALIGSLGSGNVSGERVPVEAGDIAAQWPDEIDTEPWVQPIAVRAAAWDAAVTWHAAPLQFSGFFQGATGDPELVQTTLEDRPVGAFLASDLSFLRAHMFPLDTAVRGGGWSLPPGVGGHGLVAAGLAATAGFDATSVRLGASSSSATVPVCVGCADDASGHVHYGEELDLMAWTRAGVLAPVLEGGVFFPGAFFVDGSSTDRAEVSDLPLGWRVFAGVGASFGTLR